MPSIVPVAVIAPIATMSRGRRRPSHRSASGLAGSVPPQTYFVGSAVFHYLGPAFAVLLFARVAAARRGVAADRERGGDLRRSGAGRGAACGRARRRRRAGCARARRRARASMNACFYLAIDRLPLGTVAAIEFLPVIALAALGARTRAERGSRSSPPWPASTCSRTCGSTGEPLGVAFAFANAALFAALHRARPPRLRSAAASAGSTASRRRCSSRSSSSTPIGGWARRAGARRPGRRSRPGSASASPRR